MKATSETRTFHEVILCTPCKGHGFFQKPERQNSGNFTYAPVPCTSCRGSGRMHKTTSIMPFKR